jgi:protein involved in polysaccharide export with SLBB domain
MICAAKEDDMPRPRLPKLRFGVKALFILILGIAIGFSLNLQTWKLLTGRSPYSKLPQYVIEPSDVLQINVDDASGSRWTVSNKLLVGPDGRVYLGKLGSVYVAGMTIGEAHSAIEQQVAKTLTSPHVTVDIYAYNSKTYYVITELGKSGDTVSEYPITGNDTVLDAIAASGGITLPGPVQILISRPAPNGIGLESKLRVDWDQISTGKSNNTNYHLKPRDRVIISRLRPPATNL